MDDLFLVYVKAALLVVIGVLLLIGVTVTGWQAKVAFVQHIVAWCRGIPARFRAWRDPELKRERERVTTDIAQFKRYTRLLSLLQDAYLDAYIRVVQNDGGGSPPLVNAHTMSRETVVAYFIALSDDDITALARGVRDFLLLGAASVGEVEAFLREERERLSETPFLADTHLTRLMSRFGSRIARVDLRN